jgi:hypothetical protein
MSRSVRINIPLCRPMLNSPSGTEFALLPIVERHFRPGRDVNNRENRSFPRSPLPL